MASSKDSGTGKRPTILASVNHSLEREGALPASQEKLEGTTPDKVSRVTPAVNSTANASVHTLSEAERIEQIFKTYPSKSNSASGREIIELALQMDPLAAFRTAHFHHSLELLEKAAFCYGSARRSKLSIISSLLNEQWLNHKVDFVSGEALGRIEQSFSEGRLISGSLSIERKGFLDLALRGLPLLDEEMESTAEVNPRSERPESPANRRDEGVRARNAFPELPSKSDTNEHDLTAEEVEAAPEPELLPRGKVLIFPKKPGLKHY
jgi:hypothetical protein